MHVWRERKEMYRRARGGAMWGHAHCAYLYVRAEYSRDSSLYGPAAAPQSATGIRVHVRGVMR